MRLAAGIAAGFALVASAGAGTGPVSQLRVGSAPYRVAISRGNLWVSVNGASAVARIDPRRARITGRFQVGGGPGSLVVANHAVWIGNYGRDRSIMRLDPTHGRVRRIRVGTRPIAVDAAGGAIWVADAGDSRVTKLSARTGKLLLRRSLPNELHEGLVVQPDGVWVSSEDGIVHKLDPATGKTLLKVKVGDDADYITAGGGAVWVSCYLDDRLWRLDPATGKVLQTIVVGTGAQGMAVAGSSLWVAKYDKNRVYRVDTGAGRVAQTFRTGPQPRGVVIASGSVWVANSSGWTLTRVRL